MSGPSQQKLHKPSLITIESLDKHDHKLYEPSLINTESLDKHDYKII